MTKDILENFVDYFEKYKNISDEPITDSSLVSYYALTSLAKGKIKFALGGDAADELLCGYDTFKAMKYIGFCRISGLGHSRHLSHRNVKLTLNCLRFLRNTHLRSIPVHLCITLCQLHTAVNPLTKQRTRRSPHAGICISRAGRSDHRDG